MTKKGKDGYTTTDSIAESLRLNAVELHSFTSENWERYGAIENDRGRYEVHAVYIGDLVRDFKA